MLFSSYANVSSTTNKIKYNQTPDF